MQKQLLEMTDVPLQIQSKIAMVTKALEQFMTMDPEAFERVSLDRDESQELSSEKQFSSIPEENEEDEIESERNNNDESFDHYEIDHSTRETSCSLEELEQQFRKFQESEEATDVEKSNDDEDEDEKSVCESVKSEEMLKLEEEKRMKNEKILKLEKSWQKLCSNTKTVHK